MTSSDYYQPDEPLAEREEERHCCTCKGDRWHMTYVWPGPVVETECRDCKTVSEVDTDA